MDTIAQRIKKALSLRDMKQSELVAMTKISKSSISTYVSGTYEPKQRNIYKIAKALNVNEAWLMGYDVPMERELKHNVEFNLEKFNSLDEKGKHTVNTVLDMEYNRCSVKDTKPVIHHLAAHADDEDNKELLKKDIDMITGDDW